MRIVNSVPAFDPEDEWFDCDTKSLWTFSPPILQLRSGQVYSAGFCFFDTDLSGVAAYGEDGLTRIFDSLEIQPCSFY